MISKRELEQLRAEWSLDIGVIEKDSFSAGYLRGSVGTPSSLTAGCSRAAPACGSATTRPSAFPRTSTSLSTTADRGPRRPGPVLPKSPGGSGKNPDRANGRRHWLGDGGWRGRLTARPVAYRGPNPPPVSAGVQVDLTADEVLVHNLMRQIGHQYSDAPLPVDGVSCYSITELFAEKLRALSERCRPRDLYDVVHMHRHPDLVGIARRSPLFWRRSAATPASRYLRSTRFAHLHFGKRSRTSGRTCSATSCRGRCHLSQTSADTRRRLPLAGGQPKASNCRGLRWAASTPDGRHPGLSRHGDEACLWNCFATPGRTASRSTSTTGRKADVRRRARRVDLSLRRTQDGNLVLFVVNDHRRTAELPPSTGLQASARRQRPSCRGSASSSDLAPSTHDPTEVRDLRDV